METLVKIQMGDASAEVAEAKQHELFARLGAVPSLIVALSGGIDSAYLAWAAHRTLGNRALSMTALSPSYSAHDRSVVEEFARKHGVGRSSPAATRRLAPAPPPPPLPPTQPSGEQLTLL